MHAGLMKLAVPLNWEPRGTFGQLNPKLARYTELLNAIGTLAPKLTYLEIRSRMPSDIFSERLLTHLLRLQNLETILLPEHWLTTEIRQELNRLPCIRAIRPARFAPLFSGQAHCD